MSDGDKYLLGSVNNTLLLLDLLSRHEELGVAEISAMMEMSKASVFRMLYTLEQGRYIDKTREAKYRLGLKFAHYGNIVLERLDILALVKPYLQSLRDRFNETIHMAILDRDYNIVLLAKEVGTATMQINSHVGAKMKGYCTATGKVMLAQMDDEELRRVADSFEYVKHTEYTILSSQELIGDVEKIRSRGYAEDREESEVGLTCFAAPLWDIRGRCRAAISISGPSQRMLGNKATLVASLQEAAAEISGKLGYVK